MIEKIIDNRGLSCPLPVVNTKKALEENAEDLAAGQTTVSIVDNDTASMNVQRFAKKAGYQVLAEEKSDGIYISISSGTHERPAQGVQKPESEGCECSCVSPSGGEPEVVFLVTSSALGQGSEELGKLLMTSFFNTFLNGEPFPSKVLFMNSGVFLTAEGSPVLDSLNRMSEKGVEILSCGTCLDYYQLKDKLKVGEVTNMYDTVETLSSPAYRCVTI